MVEIAPEGHAYFAINFSSGYKAWKVFSKLIDCDYLKYKPLPLRFVGSTIECDKPIPIDAHNFLTGYCTGWCEAQGWKGEQFVIADPELMKKQ